jgi:ribokinase
MKILVIGSSNTDMVVKTARFPEPGETIIGGDFFMFPGGKGANQAVAAARLNGDVHFICKVGNDIFGQQAIAGFKAEGIDTSGCLVDDQAPSGVALITVNAEGENEIVVASGANNNLLNSDLTQLEAHFEKAEIVLMQLETPLETIATAAKLGQKYQAKVIINPAPAQAIEDETLARLFLITPNETEAKILTGIEVSDDETAHAAADALLAKGVQNVIITLGSKGAFFKNTEDSFQVAAPKVQAVDTTAAGDVFNGALAVALAEGKDWQSCLDFACRAASISVTRMGAQASAPRRSEV